MQEISIDDFKLFSDIEEKLYCQDLSDQEMKELFERSDKACKIATSLLEICLEDMGVSSEDICEIMHQISILSGLARIAGTDQALRAMEMIPFERDMGSRIC